MPNKYHEFIKPSVHRAYVDLKPHEALIARIAELEKNLNSTLRDKQLLMDKCEQNLDASQHHAKEEKKVRKEAEKLKRDLALMKIQNKKLQAKLDKST